MRITYYRSKELKDFYPQTGDAEDFLLEYASQNPNFSLKIAKADEKILASYGISGRQIRSDTGTKTEFSKVYSAVVIQYLDQVSVIPFVLSNQNLEFDLTRRLEELIDEKSRNIFVIAGENFDLDEDFSYLKAFLTSDGFNVYEIEKSNILQALDSMEKIRDGSILILGSSALTMEEAASIELAVKNGVPAVIMASPYSVDIKREWNLSKNPHDFLLPALNSWGFSFSKSLAADISSFPLTMQSGEGEAAEYVSINYPLFVSLLPQENAPLGGTLFWASPLDLYGNARPLFYSSPYAWKEKELNSEPIFLTNPFTMPKSSNEAGAESGQLVLAGKIEGKIRGYYEGGEGSYESKVALIPSLYFCQNTTTNLISSQNGGDFRNFEIVSNLFYDFNNQKELASLKNKGFTDSSLYKITAPEEFEAVRKKVIFVVFAVIPLLILLCGFLAFIVRKAFNRRAI